MHLSNDVIISFHSLSRFDPMIISIISKKIFQAIFYFYFVLLKKLLDFHELAPYSYGNCEQYTSCMGCISDELCGWCGGSCSARSPNSTCVDQDGHLRMMHHKQDQCVMCSDHFTCTECQKVRISSHTVCPEKPEYFELMKEIKTLSKCKIMITQRISGHHCIV